MAKTVEREVRLEPADDFVLPELPGGPLEDRVFTSTYHDTPRLSLARVGITLRRRLENGVSLWQLELPREGAGAAVEERGGPAAPPGAVNDLLVAHLRHGPLQPVATLRTRRSGVRVLDGDRTVADVTFDRVDVLDGSRSLGRFGELEVQLVDGDPDDLDRLSRTLRDAGAAPGPGPVSVMRVLPLDLEPEPGRKASPVEHVRHLLRRQFLMLEAHDPGVRLGDDIEDMHRLRVASRRSRALLRAARALVGDRLEPLNAELRWLGSVLGPVRDLDVLLEHLNEEATTLVADREGVGRILAAFEAQRDEARAAMLQALSGERYLALLDRFEVDLAQLPALATPVTLQSLALRDLKRLRKAMRELGDDPPDDALHAARIRAKRARYTAELAGTVEKPFRRVAAALTELQDTIGAHQDAVVADEKIRSVADSVAAGRLIEREYARRARARADMPGVWHRIKRASAGVK